MDALSRIIVQSPMFQGEDERIAYRLNTTPWGTSPASPSVVLYDDAGANVSATYMTGSPTVSGVMIIAPVVHSLVRGNQYRMEIKWTDSGNTFETWMDITAQR